MKRTPRRSVTEGRRSINAGGAVRAGGRKKGRPPAEAPRTAGPYAQLRIGAARRRGKGRALNDGAEEGAVRT